MPLPESQAFYKRKGGGAYVSIFSVYWYLDYGWRIVNRPIRLRDLAR